MATEVREKARPNRNAGMPVRRVLYTRQSDKKRFLIQDAAIKLAASTATIANDNTYPRAGKISIDRSLPQWVGCREVLQGSFRLQVMIVSVMRSSWAGRECRCVGS